MRYLLAIPLIVFALALPASADHVVCSLTTEIDERLKTKYNELPTALGFVGKRQVAILFQSEDKSTWTFGIRHVNGVTCLLAAGKDWSGVERRRDYQ